MPSNIPYNRSSFRRAFEECGCYSSEPGNYQASVYTFSNYNTTPTAYTMPATKHLSSLWQILYFINHLLQDTAHGKRLTMHTDMQERRTPMCQKHTFKHKHFRPANKFASLWENLSYFAEERFSGFLSAFQYIQPLWKNGYTCTFYWTNLLYKFAWNHPLRHLIHSPNNESTLMSLRTVQACTLLSWFTLLLTLGLLY